VQDQFSRHVRATRGRIEEEDEYADHRRPKRVPERVERRSKSVDAQAHKGKTDDHCGQHPRRARGQVNIRIVDFAHTTTGRDFVRYTSETTDPPNLGKGYHSLVDQATGLAIARFPPKYPSQPDLGFIFGLKSVVEALDRIWETDMRRREERGEKREERGEVRNKGVFEMAFQGIEDGDLST
jgi:inositol-hexakisphosphate kinase